MRKLLAISSFALVVGCGEDVDFNETPQIELISVGPSQVVELQDSIRFVIGYEDGDGDLGENSPDAKNLFLRDERINLEYKFRIRELVPNQAEVPIKGELILTLPNTVITDGSTSQNVTYSIWVKDRAGHQSNTLTAGPITVVVP